MQDNIEDIVKTISEMYTQVKGKYYVSDEDFNDYNRAVNDINALFYELVMHYKNINKG